MPLLSSKLPAYSGPHPVGLIDIEVPVSEQRLISKPVFKQSGEPAFELQTVLFSLYYPTAAVLTRSKPRHRWVENTAQQAEGYARLAHINNAVVNCIFHRAMWALVGSTTIPANVDVPIQEAEASKSDLDLKTTSSQSTDTTSSQFPVIVLTHGTAGGRNSYTQFCGELASRGFIVATIEHRDGSGPSTEIARKNSKPRALFNFGRSELEPQPEDEEFKTMQRAMRQAEIEETVRVLKMIQDGKGEQVFVQNSRQEGEGLDQWKGRLDMDRIIIAGHSFGATTALQVLDDAPSETFPFAGGVMFDPGKQSGNLSDSTEVPIVVCHSQSWSARMSIFQGRPHFTVVKDLVQKVLRCPGRKSPHAAWFLTSKGTTHPSITDAPLIEPFLLSWTTGSTIDAREGVLQYVKITEEFMRYLTDGQRVGILAEDVTHPTYDEDIRCEERKKEMSREISKYWQVHVAPPTE